MRLDRRTLAIIIFILAIMFSKDLLKGNVKPLLKSIHLINMFQRFGNIGRRFNIRGLSMITRSFNSFKNIKLIENIKKNHKKKTTHKKDNKTQKKKVKKN